MSDDLKNIIINEVLFNPVRDGYDYVEGYNKGYATINLQHIRIANRNTTGDISSIRILTREPLLLAPQSFFIVTANERWLRQHYHVPLNAIICTLSSLPSFPDDKGTVVFLDQDDHILDELNYAANWHFTLLSNREGVALERINYYTPTQDRNNWTSASSSSGFGTPGFRNSHFLADSRVGGEVTVFPRIISPDNDGIDDFGTIRFQLPEPGYVANLSIYDINGRKVRYLLRNEYVGVTAQYNWHGEDDRQYPLPSGVYILVTEIYSIGGYTKKYKHSLVVYRGNL